MLGLLGRQRADVAAGAQGVDQQDVRQFVELAHVLALYVAFPGVTEDAGQRRAADLVRDALRGRGKGGENADQVVVAGFPAAGIAVQAGAPQVLGQRHAFAIHDDAPCLRNPCRSVGCGWRQSYQKPGSLPKPGAPAAVPRLAFARENAHNSAPVRACPGRRRDPPPNAIPSEEGVPMSTNELAATARALVAEGKGILAADESTGTITRRLDTIQVASTPENRRAYREMLFTAPEVEAYISGVILYDETIRQESSDGTPFPALLAARGIMPGIKVDTGTADLAGFAGEKITEGLGRPRQAAGRLPRDRRPLRQVARRDHHWPGLPDGLRHRRQRPRPGALRGAVATGRAGADCRAGGADGRRPHDRALRRGDPI